MTNGLLMEKLQGEQSAWTMCQHYGCTEEGRHGGLCYFHSRKRTEKILKKIIFGERLHEMEV